MASKSKYFTTTKKGEIHELKEELANDSKKKEAVKKVIAAMTVGKDVSMLFPDVVKCIRTDNLELKKLVYLYIMNYAKSNPDLAFLAVNTFVKDATSPDPLIRALAIRTMGCIRINCISEYLCQPLHTCLKDPDPYVRKTAAVCVVKLYDISPELVEDRGFLENLVELLSDINPMVVVNAVAALSEIQETYSKNVLQITPQVSQKLFAAMNECTEWGQVFILNALANYRPRDSREAADTCERVTPRLQHANSAVVLAAVKVIMKLIEMIPSNEIVRTFCKKMAPPLVTMLSKEPEVQYVALRNINLIVQKRPSILQYETKVFFCKYNDPIYVKMEKLEIMVMLASERNIDQLLLEFKEYATEVDVEFVRKAVRAIGRCAIKLERAAQRCMQVLVDLIQTKVNYVVQEAIIVVKDIFRKYPNQYESILAILCQNLDTLDEPEAKAAIVWVIGEYADRIDNADELLEMFLDSFQDENTQVQLQLLTATVKLFLKKPKESQALVQSVLHKATQESDNPDLRDRGFVYWRLLSSDPEAAKRVVLSEKPLISDSTSLLEPTLLDDLISHISTLASVYHKPPETFVARLQKKEGQAKAESNDDDDEEAGDFTSPPAAEPARQAPPQAAAPNLLDLDDLASALPSQTGGGLDDLLGGGAPVASARTLPVLLTAEKGKGMAIRGEFASRVSDGAHQIFFDLNFENQMTVPLTGLAAQFNKNSFCLAPAGPISLPAIMPGQSVPYSLPLSFNPQLKSPGASDVIQIAVKNNIEIFYFQASLPFHILYADDGRLEKQQYLQMWKNVPDENEHSAELTGVPPQSAEAATNKLEQHNMFFIAKRKVNTDDLVYLSAKIHSGSVFLIELTFRADGSIKSSLKTNSTDLVPLFEASLKTLLSS